MSNNSRYRLILQFLPSILLGFGFLGFILLVKPSFPVLLLIVLLLSFGINLYFGERISKSIINSFKNGLILTIIYFIFKWIGSKGIIYAILSIIFVGLIIIFRRRKLFIKTLGDIEEEFFGRRFR